MTTKNRFRPVRRAVALEPRLLFDGAGAVAGADAFMDADAQGQEHQQDDKTHVAAPVSVTGLEGFPGRTSIFHSSVVGAAFAPAPSAGPMAMSMSLNDQGDEGSLLAMFGAMSSGELADVSTGLPPVVVGEDDDPTNIGKGVTVSGKGENLTVTVTVEHGDLDGVGKEITLSGSAKAIGDKLAELTYKYTGDSETGVTDSLKINGIEVREIKVAPQNDAPQFAEKDKAQKEFHLDIKENESAVFTGVTLDGKYVVQEQLGIRDPDNAAEQIIIKVTEIEDGGKLFLDEKQIAVGATFSLEDIGDLTYKYEGALEGKSKFTGFTINIDDGAGGLLEGKNVVIRVDPINNAPSISGSVVILEGERGQIGFSGESQNFPSILGNRGDKATITDPDYGDKGQHTLKIDPTSIPAGITLFYEGNEITDFTILNADPSEISVQIDYSQLDDATKTKLDSGHRVVNTIKVSVTDSGGGYDNEALITEGGALDIVILPNNNEPTLENNGPIHFGPDATKPTDNNTTSTIIITKQMLQIIDSDASSPNQLVYTLTEVPGVGVGFLSLDGGKTALKADHTFTQADLDSGKLTYHARQSSTVDNPVPFEFKFEVTDGGLTFAFDENGQTTASPREGGIYDGDELKKHSFVINYYGDAKPGEGENESPGDWVQPSLGEVKFDSKPVLENGEGKFNEWLTYTPANPNIDDSGQLVYRLESQPNNGQILLNGEPLEQFATFTQADIENITFKHGGSEYFTVNFSLSVTNGFETKYVGEEDGNGQPKGLTIDIAPQNDSPIATGKDVVVAEGGAVEFEIKLEDPDNDPNRDKKDTDFARDNEVGYRIDSLPAHGNLYLVDSDFDVENVEAVKNLKNEDALIKDKELKAGDLNGKKLIYVHDGSESSEASFKIIPIDDSEALPDINNKHESSEGDQITIKITITPLNDAPVFVSKEDATGEKSMQEGGTIDIGGKETDKYHLVYSDSDNKNTQRQYRIINEPKFGALMRDGVALNRPRFTRHIFAS